MPTSLTGNGTGVIQSLGVGSGLDIKSLVTQLVAADRAPSDARLTRQSQKIATQLSALGTLKGAMSTFQSALKPFDTVSNFQAKSAVSADETLFTVTAGSAAVAGNYGVEVRQLAQPEQLISSAFVGGAATAVGTGTLHISTGGSAFDLVVTSSNNTLASIRDAINTAANNSGVHAALIYGATGAQLVLTSAQTGLANSIRIAMSGGDGGLAKLTYDGTTGGHYTEAQKAQDAIVLLSGVEIHSASNVVDKAIDGVTINLKAAKTGTTVNLAVADDQASVADSVQKLVTAYNAMQSQFHKLGNYDAATKTGGPLLGDWLLNGTQFELTRGMTDQVTESNSRYSSLAALGVTTAADGTLGVNTTKLQAALKADPSSVAQLFSGTHGLAARLGTTLDKLLATSGAIAARNKNLAAAQTEVTVATTRLDTQMSAVQQRYLKQFNALDSLLQQLNSTSTYLTQQLAVNAKI